MIYVFPLRSLIFQSICFNFYFTSHSHIFSLLLISLLQDRNSSSYKSLRNAREKRSYHSSHHHYRGSAGAGSGVDDSLPASTSPYHIATQRKYPRGTQSCYDGLSDDFDRFSSMNRSFASTAHSKYKVSFMDFHSHFQISLF